MVIGLAMCTTLAFAQTQRFENLDRKVNKSAGKPVDYKASIFTKDAEIDTIALFTFADTTMGGFIYGGNGTITEAHNNTTIYGLNGYDTVLTLFEHASTSDAAVWNRIPDSAYILSETYLETYSYDTDWVYWYSRVLQNNFGGSRSVGGDNGFMFMSMIDANAVSVGKIHASFTLPEISMAGHDAPILDVSMLQIYRCFNNDRCYVDYQIGGNWKAMEINVRGIDCESNEWASFRPAYTMPVELASQTTLKLRIRWGCSSKVGGAYGYFWAIDDLCVIGGTNDRWYRGTEYYVDGAYGQMPQGMKIPLTWYSTAVNNGVNQRGNIYTTAKHIDANGVSTIATHSEGNFAAEPTVRHDISINERGFMNLDSASYQWWGFSDVYFTDSVPANYGYLPVETVGNHAVTVSVTSDGADTLEGDTILYRVINKTGESYTYGYRWAHDNGIIPNRSAYTFGFTAEADEQGYYYLTDTGGYDNIGYEVAVRYTTPSEVPEGWALLGVEIVPSTDMNIVDYMDEVEISPSLYYHYYDEAGSLRLGSLNTGFSGTHIVNSADEANFDVQKYILPGEDYQSIVMEFPNQPFLEPNVSYMIGYNLESSGYFAAAATRYGFYEGNTFTRYYEDEDAAPYYNQFVPCGYDVFVYDGRSGQYTFNAASSESHYPMIRAIVGPRSPRPAYTITALCEENDTVMIYSTNLRADICNDRDTAYETGSATFYVMVPDSNEHNVITEVFIDDQWYDPSLLADGTISIEDVSVSEESDVVKTVVDGDTVPALYRYYYVFTFEDIHSDHVLKAHTEWTEWRIGIDPVANESVLAVMPNPATSQVRVNISGVTGMVNCNIIDMSGRVVYNSDFNAEMGQNIDLSTFARGAYFVRVTNGTFSKIEKLIVR